MRIPGKKIARIIGMLFGGLLLLVCLAVAGVLVWLRTDSGERFVADTAISVLADQGLFLTVDAIDGPLPSRVLLTNVSLADARGKWFAARELEVALSLTDLLRKTARVNLVRLDTPKVFRLPELPQSGEPTPESAPESPAAAPYFSLPIAVSLDKLLVAHCGIFAPLLFPEAAQGDAPLLQISLDGTANAPALQPLEAVLALTASVADMKTLTAQLQAGDSPLTGFSLDLGVKASVGALIEATLKGTLAPEAWEEKLLIEYAVHAQLAGTKAALRSALVKGLGLSLEAKGGADLETKAVRAEAVLATESGGKWESVATKLTGQDMGGAIKAAVTTSIDPDQTIAASVDASGADMRWGTEQLQQILGPKFTVKAEADGNQATRFSLNLATLQSGTVSASGKASFGPGDKSLSAALEAALSDIAAAAPGVEGALRAKINASGTLDAPSANLEIVSDTLKTDAASIEKLHAVATLSGTLAAPAATLDASAVSIVADAAAMKGLAAKVRLSGTMAAPVFSLEATSDTVTTQAGEFKQFRAGMDGTAALPERGDKAVQATADIRFGASPAGPVALRTNLAASQNNAGSMTARLHGLDLVLAGTSLAADITATLPAATGNAAPQPIIDGTASASITDWKPIAALSGQPISGTRAGFDAKFSHSANVQHITASLRADSLTLPDVFSLNGLSGKLEARDLANPDIALNLVIGKGEAGPVAWQTGAVAVNAQRGNGTFAAALRTDGSAGKALATAGKTPPTQPGKAERLTALGSFDLSPLRVTLDRLAARVPQSPMGVYLTEPVTVALDKGATVENLKLNVVPGKGSVALNAVLHPNSADVAATITEFPLQLLRDAVDAPVPDGTLSAEAVIKKTGATIRGTVNAKALVSPPAAGGIKAPPVAVTLASTLDQNADPNFPQLRSGNGISRLKGNVTIGFEEKQAATANAPDARVNFNFPFRSPEGGILEPATQAPMQATVAWRGEVSPLWKLAPMQDREFSGLAQIDADVSGTMEKPEYQARAYIANGQFYDHIAGLMLTKIALEAASSSSGDSRIILRAEDDAGGHVALEGTLTPGSGPDNGQGPSVPQITARGQLNHLQPLHRDDIFVRLSGRIAVNGPLDAMRVGGNITVERGELSIANLAGSVRTLDIADPSAKPAPPTTSPELAITIAIPNRFYIRGGGLDSEWAGNLAIAGKASSPSLTGSLNPVRGTLTLMSRDFALSEGDISFMGGDRIDPGLNLALTYDGPNILAIIRAQGTASKPKLVMESRPPLPQDQIMAEVLFGKAFSKLSRFEAMQAANGLRQLASIGRGGGGLDPLTAMRSSLGIDMLRVGSSDGTRTDDRSVSGAPGAGAIAGSGSSSSGGDSASTPTLEAGKYINDVVYVGVEQGATTGSTSVRIEVELRPNLNLQGQTSTSSSQIGLGWKKDY